MLVGQSDEKQVLAIRCILKDERGEVVECFAKKVGASYVLAAEAYTIREACFFYFKSGLSNVFKSKV